MEIEVDGLNMAVRGEMNPSHGLSLYGGRGVAEQKPGTLNGA